MNELIKDYLETRIKPKSQETYKAFLNKFFKNLGLKPEDFIKKDTKEITDIIQKFINKESEKISPKYIYGIKEAVIGFLRFKEIYLNPNQIHDIKTQLRRTSSITYKETPSKQQLKEILQHGETKARAMFLMLASSGMRINELLHLTPENIDIENNPTKIIIPAKLTKAKKPRVTFISNEATEILKAWLKEKDQYLQNASNKYSTDKLKRNKPTNDNRIFPMGYENARIIWERLLKQSGYNKKDNGRYIFRIHSLRSYFIQRMMTKNIQQGIIDLLAGHKSEYSIAYHKFPPSAKDLATHYLNAMQELEVFETTPDLTEINEKIERLEKENKELKETVHEAIQDNIEQRLNLELTSTIIAHLTKNLNQKDRAVLLNKISKKIPHKKIISNVFEELEKEINESD